VFEQTRPLTAKMSPADVEFVALLRPGSKIFKLGK
jgi:hypothetical protein